MGYPLSERARRIDLFVRDFRTAQENQPIAPSASGPTVTVHWSHSQRFKVPRSKRSVSSGPKDQGTVVSTALAVSTSGACQRPQLSLIQRKAMVLLSQRQNVYPFLAKNSTSCRPHSSNSLSFGRADWLKQLILSRGDRDLNLRPPAPKRRRVSSSVATPGRFPGSNRLNEADSPPNPPGVQISSAGFFLSADGHPRCRRRPGPRLPTAPSPRDSERDLPLHPSY
jgi:hypothetical protein